LLPESSVEDEEGDTRQLTYQEVQDLPTVNVSPREDGLYYFPATAQASHRALTYIEYMTSESILVEAQDLPPFPESES